LVELTFNTLIGDVNNNKIYMDSDIDDKTNPPTTANSMGVDKNKNIYKIPTLPETARKVARLEKK
jgi:hypothetical protein